MQEQIPETVAQVLDVLGEKFGATGAHLWEVMVRQQYINSVTLCFGFAAAAALIAVLALTGRHFLRKFIDDPADEFCEFAAATSFIVAGIVALATAATFFIAINDIIMGFMNPEYGALEEVLRTIGR